MKFNVLVISLLLTPFFAKGFQAKKALKDIEKNEWAKAEETIKKSLQKDSTDLAAFHAYSLLLSESKAPQFNIDSARYFNLLATKQWGLKEEKEQEKLRKINIDASILQLQKELIDSVAFILALQQGTEDGFNHFLQVFPDSKQRQKAIESRNRIAYESAEQKNSIDSFKEFLSRYPKSEQTELAQKKLDQLIYEDQAKNADLNQMINFLKEHPESPFSNEVEEKVFKQMTGIFTSEDINKFIDLFPKSRYIKNAYDFLLHLNGGAISLKSFLAKYPKYPRADSVEKLLHAEEGFLMPQIHGNKISFINSSEKEISLNSYDDPGNILKCSLITSDLITIKSGEYLSVLNRNEKLIYKGNLDSITRLGNGFIRISKQGKQGLIHMSGYVFFEPEYRDIELLSGSVLKFRKATSWGMMDPFQKILLSDEFTSIGNYDDVIILNKNGSIALVTLGEIIEKEKTLTLDFPYDDVYQLPDGSFIGTRDDSETLLDPALKVVIPAGEHEIIQITDNWLVSGNNKADLFSKNGELLIGSINNFIINGNKFGFKKNGKWFIFGENSKGYDSIKFLNSKIFLSTSRDGDLAHFSGGNTLNLANSSTYQLVTSNYNNNINAFFLTFDKDGVKRLYDSSGKKVLAGWFDEISPLADFIFQIEEKKLKGLSDSTGRNILPIKYDGLGKFENGNVSLLKKGKFGNYNYPKKKVIEPEYDIRLKPFGDSLFVASSKKKYGVINQDNKVILPFEFDEIEFWNSTAVLAKKNGQWQITSLVQDNPIFIQYLQKTSEPSGKEIYIYKTSKGYGVHALTGEVVPSAFTDLNYIKNDNEMVYVAGKYLPETDLYVIAYFDTDGSLIWRSSVEKEDYSKYLCK